jgi:hypothetical protein
MRSSKRRAKWTKLFMNSVGALFCEFGFGLAGRFEGTETEREAGKTKLQKLHGRVGV